MLREREPGEKAQYRHELKYLLSVQEAQILFARVKSILCRDAHAGADGGYLIRSIYFDDPEDTCLRENEAGTGNRKKWRIRTYNLEDSRILLECKSKVRDLVRKESCLLTRQLAEALLAGAFPGAEAPEETPPADPLLSRFLAEASAKRLRPKVLVQYRRVPFVFATGNVRVTFDTGISSSHRTDLFFEKTLPVRPVLPSGRALLEVKYDALIPDHIFRTVQLKHMRQETFSKYCLCRRFSTI